MFVFEYFKIIWEAEQNFCGYAKWFIELFPWLIVKEKTYRICSFTRKIKYLLWRLWYLVILLIINVFRVYCVLNILNIAFSYKLVIFCSKISSIFVNMPSSMRSRTISEQKKQWCSIWICRENRLILIPWD